MQIRSKLTLIVCALLSGCVSDVSFRRFDNPTIRQLQEAETARHIKDDSARATLKKSIGERVSLVYSAMPSDAESDGGRVTAVTSDGYHLTAYHVVRDRTFFIEKTKMIRQPPKGPFKSSTIDRYFSKQRYPGRLVWHDPDNDLAIVKFPFTNSSHFKTAMDTPEKGDLVYTADDEGRGFIPANEQNETSFENMLGNGRFFAAGTVRSSSRRNRGARITQITTTLVGRGGMSGAPLVTTDHELCGIIQRIKLPGFFRSPKTVASMIPPDLLHEIIETDRAEQETGGEAD